MSLRLGFSIKACSPDQKWEQREHDTPVLWPRNAHCPRTNDPSAKYHLPQIQGASPRGNQSQPFIGWQRFNPHSWPTDALSMFHVKHANA